MTTKALVIEDDVIIRMDIAFVLKSLGYEVFKAGNGTLGLEIATREMPHLVICDFNLPDMTGIETLTQLKLLPCLQATRFILCSGSLLTDENLTIVDGYLSKPFHPKQLTGMIDKFNSIGNNKLNQALG